VPYRHCETNQLGITQTFFLALSLTHGQLDINHFARGFVRINLVSTPSIHGKEPKDDNIPIHSPRRDRRHRGTASPAYRSGRFPH